MIGVNVSLNRLQLLALFGVALLTVCGCAPLHRSAGSRSEKAIARGNRIQANSTAADVALSTKEREEFYKNVEQDTFTSSDNTNLLIGTAYRNPEEKRLLVKQIPIWFSSSRLETRCMAFRMVKFLKLSQFRSDVDALQLFLERKANLNPVEKLELDDINSFRSEP